MRIDHGILSMGASLILHLIGFLTLLLIPLSTTVHDQNRPLFLTVPPSPTILFNESSSTFNPSITTDQEKQSSPDIPKLVFPLKKLLSVTEDLSFVNSKAMKIKEILPDSTKALKLALAEFRVAKVAERPAVDLVFKKNSELIDNTLLAKCLKSKLKYPLGLRAQGLQTDVELRWKQTSAGEIDVFVVESSGFITVDDRVALIARQCLFTLVTKTISSGSVRIHYVPERGF